MSLMLGETPSPAETTSLSGNFFERHPLELSELFTVLDMPGAGESLDAAVTATQPWVKGDHGFDSYVFNFTEEQKWALPSLYERFDQVQQRDLATGHYDQILVFGAVHKGNDKRMKFLSDMLKQGVSTDQIVLLGGERKMFPGERESNDILKNLDSLESKGPEDVWLTRFLDKPVNEIDETDMLRIAALDHLGPLALSRQHLHVGLENTGLTSTPVRRTELSWSGAPLTLMHTRARPRKDGAPRHTTEACVVDWAQTFDPAAGSRVAIIGSQPHQDRMAQSTQRTLRSLDRQIELVPGGPGTTQATGHTIYLGEIARGLYEAQQAAITSAR